MMNEELLKKLKYKGTKALVLDLPEGIPTDLSFDTQLPEIANGEYPFVVIFLSCEQELRERFPLVVPHLGTDAVFWLCYPKKIGKSKPDVNRDIIWRLVQDISDYTLVANVAINEQWSALRVRHRSFVK